MGEARLFAHNGSPALAEVVRDLQWAAHRSRSSFSQRNLFELALDRLAGEFAAVIHIAKLDAIDMLIQTLVQAKATSVAAGAQQIADV